MHLLTTVSLEQLLSSSMLRKVEARMWGQARIHREQQRYMSAGNLIVTEQPPLLYYNPVIRE